MSLITTSRALDDEMFLARVAAASLAIAQEESVAGRRSVYVDRCLDNPLMRDKTMAALVASDPEVSEQFTVNPEQYTVGTNSVTDEAIVNAVRRVWSSVASRYEPTTTV